jgi:membrane fusion protein, heavy metal efflux system
MKFKLVTIFSLALLLALSCRHKEINAVTKFCLTSTMELTTTVDTVKTGVVEEELKLTGKITYDEEKVIKIYPQVSGVVKEVKVGIGEQVKKGQILAIIKSSEMAGFENDLNNAQSNFEISRKNLDVTEDMYKGGLSSEKEFIVAKNELKKAESELNKVKNISSVYGGSNTSEYYIIAPISGVIIEKHINPDLQIRPDFSENLFIISDLKDVWVMANVFESDIPKVKKGYSALIKTLSYPDKIINGKIDNVYNILDPVSKVMKVRIKIENREYELKPEMFAYVTIKYSENVNKIVVPSRAVVFDNSKNYVLVYKDKCNIEPREIVIYKSVNGKTYIDTGLEKGERIVINNALLIYDQLTD